jgi:hypothetical protein
MNDLTRLTSFGHPRFFVSDLECEFEIPDRNRHNSTVAERPAHHSNMSLAGGVPLKRSSAATVRMNGASFD